MKKLLRQLSEGWPGLQRLLGSFKWLDVWRVLPTFSTCFGHFQMFVVAINAKLANFCENGANIGRKIEWKKLYIRQIAWCRVLVVSVVGLVESAEAVDGVGAAE